MKSENILNSLLSQIAARYEQALAPRRYWRRSSRTPLAPPKGNAWNINKRKNLYSWALRTIPKQVSISGQSSGGDHFGEGPPGGFVNSGCGFDDYIPNNHMPRDLATSKHSVLRANVDDVYHEHHQHHGETRSLMELTFVIYAKNYLICRGNYRDPSTLCLWDDVDDVHHRHHGESRLLTDPGFVIYTPNNLYDAVWARSEHSMLPRRRWWRLPSSSPPSRRVKGSSEPLIRYLRPK